MANVLYGVDADIARSRENRHEHLRRLAEIANLMLGAGVILIVSTQELTQEELELVRTTIDPERIATVWIGDRGASDLEPDLSLSLEKSDDENVDAVWWLLVERGVLFTPW